MMYVEMGTAAHKAVQQYLGYQGVLYGNWRCSLSGETWSNTKYPGRCESCGATPEYVEYSLVHPDKSIGEFGHCDGIVPLGDGYAVLEIKTTSTKGLVYRKKEGPVPEHLLQASAYLELLDKGYAKVIFRGPRSNSKKPAEAVLPGKPKVILFVYIDRNSPEIRNWVVIPHKPTKGILKELERVAPVAESAISTGKLPKGVCSQKDDALSVYGEWCVWTDVCFGGNLKNVAKKLWGEYQQKVATDRHGRSA